MQKAIRYGCVILLILQSLTVMPHCYAQTRKKRAHRSVRDSIREKVQQRDSVIRSLGFPKGSVNILLGKIEDYTNAYVATNSDLSRGFDTLDISERLPVLESRMAVLRTTINNSTTLENMITIRGIVDHLKEELNNWQDQFTDYNNQLDKVRTDMADFKADTTLRTVPADSSLRIKIADQVRVLEHKWGSLNSAVEKSTIKLGLLENRVSALSILIIDLDDRIDFKIHEFNVKALSNESGFIWNMHELSQPGSLTSAVAKTYALNARLYRYFVISKANYAGHLGSLLLAVLFGIWIYSGKKRLTRNNEAYQAIFNQVPYILAHPYLSVLTVVSIISPYLYDHPAQVFAHTMLLIMMGSIGLLVRDNWPKPLFRFWSLLFVTALFFCISSLLILATYADRIILIALSGLLVYGSLALLRAIKAAPDTYPPYISVILKVFICLHGASVLLNLAGRFSLAKIAGVTATLNLCLAMGFYLLIQIILESLFLQLEANKNISKSNTVISYLDFKVLQKKLKDILVKLSFILWLVALTKNLTIDDYLYNQGSDFLNRPYKFSSTAFTFRSVLIFFIIIYLSGLLARVISYFYDFEGPQIKLTPQAKKTRSSILLIRLAVFTVGFFVAITAAGIPMDRVTIIIGALGVGIGFGLQNIVNNLVSGVILAFEKPVQVGDIIEVSNKSGTIKEIGIRSSKIECGDGSELIIPNGDLISQHVVNWTLNNNNRRVELIIRIAYGSDLEKAETVLNSILKNHGEIMAAPAPAVFIYNFSDTAIEFRIWFWAAEITSWLSLKSSVMRDIYIELAKENIVIP